MPNRRVVDWCSQVSARRYLKAPNAVVIRKHKTGQVVEVHLLNFSDDTNMRSVAGSASPTYEDSLCEGEHHLVTIKVWDPYLQAYRKWNHNDSFNPKRFNPDLVPKTLRELVSRK